MLNTYEATLLQGWEDVHKKSQLTLWVLMSLKDSPKHMAQIKQFILEQTNNLIEVDDKSMYRALRRFRDADMVSFQTIPGDKGPDLKVYAMTDTGLNVYNQFIERNILGVLLKPSVLKLLHS